MAMIHRDRYDEVPGTKCYFCGSNALLKRLYHPKQLKDQERGTKFVVCRPCYVYYKAMGLDVCSINVVHEKLTSRRRNNMTNLYMGLGLDQLEIYYDNDRNFCSVEDKETHERYDPADVQKYFEHRAWLLRQSNETLRTWCQENLKDQRFIIKVVSSFNN